MAKGTTEKGGARRKLREHFLANVGRVMDSDELRAVAGNQSEWARLHIGHVIDKSKGGSDDPSNLRAICSVCNEGAQNVTLIRPDLKQLLIQIRRGTSADQLEVLKWLIAKFPTQAAEHIAPSNK